MKRHIFRPVFDGKAVLKALFFIACMVFLNFSLPQKEPVAFPLFYALLACGAEPFLAAAGYILSSCAVLSFSALLTCTVQGIFLCAVFLVYARLRRTPGPERVLWLAIAQVPFIFLYPHTGYALFPLPDVWQKVLLALLFTVLSLLFEGAVRALLLRAFRSRLVAGELVRLSLLWLFLGLGVLGVSPILFLALSLTLVLGSVVLLRNASSVPFALVLSLPLCLYHASAVPAAEFALLSCAALAFIPYGRIVSSLAFSVAFLGAEYFEGLYTQGTLAVILTLGACLLPVLLFCCIPEKSLRRIGRSMLFYRERTLPRIAINRNRRAIGEQLYEVSALFREIETAFITHDRTDDSSVRIREKLISSLCTSCPNRRRCKDSVYGSLDKLIAVGMAKGQVTLIDLPDTLSANCKNTAGLLFALNKHLADYRRYAADREAARQGRKLLAEQAHGISEILRDIALEQSEEFAFSEEEQVLSSALTAAGILSSEIFLYGEGTRFTVSMTLEDSLSGKRLCRIAGEALGVPLTLAEKIPLAPGRACFVLKRKPRFDASFGIASRPKQGQSASGDTHSIMKIDERRFLVALSDGMGSGEEARTVSDRTLSLLESFYKAKMPTETVLSTVNRLITFSNDETFSCLDLAAVDLDTGEADVVKIGSPMGFLMSGEGLKLLEGESLPIGMLDCVHPATMRLKMKEDDFLLFMSDGVTSAFGSSAELCSYLSGLHPLNPQSLAEEILKKAEHAHGAADDDMTVLAVKLTGAA